MTGTLKAGDAILYDTHLLHCASENVSKDKRRTLVYLIPEGETRDHHTYHYTAVKTRTLTIENRKLRFKKYNPVKKKHEWFVEAKLPPHTK